jgi:uncharacterized protein (UPF0276 family)
LEVNAGLIDVLEIEPQTFWRRAPGGQSLIVDRPLLDSLLALPTPKLIHGIGFPVGGTMPSLPQELDPLRELALQLGVPWLSEHLSFNRVSGTSGVHHTSFLLPPRQTFAGVEAAAQSIRVMSSRMPAPVAIETGVSYLRPRSDELPDGEFVARVVHAADCGILLDLHNIWANERNGRQSVADFLDQLPLDRVWEVHLAGGSSHRGYWLDAHSGAVPPELVELAARILPRLPNLKALIFELFPSYLPVVGVGLFRSQLECLHRLWDARGRSFTTRVPRPTQACIHEMPPSPRDWEDTLGALAVGEHRSSPLAADLLADPGVAIIRELVGQFRASMVVRTLRLSSRLVMLERGTAYFEQLLADYWKTHPPQPFAYDEAEGFAAFLRDRNLDVPFLTEVLEYDRAVMAVALDAEERLIPFRADPLPLLRALGAGRKPTEITTGNFEVLLTPDPVSADVSVLSEMQVIH